jgi:dimethylpropiothetin dethiomethylase
MSVEDEDQHQRGDGPPGGTDHGERNAQIPDQTFPETPAVPVARLRDHPNWYYLLREFYELYRFLPSGGSEKIRGHQRAVRERVSALIQANAPLRFGTCEEKPVTAYLRRALDEGRVEKHAPVIRAIDAVRAGLNWQYGYDKVPRGLSQKFAYAEIAGPNAPVHSEAVILGLVLFAPGCTYPTHAHDGITESYVCLSGAVSENHQGVYAPGSLIFNPPGQHHRITVSDREPSLLAYAWIGAREKLSHQKMAFSRAPRKRA